MKKLMTLALAAGLAISCASEASAIDFKANGQWLMGFGLTQGSLVSRGGGQKLANNDTFSAGQRIRLKLDAVASEALSGTVYFEIGDTTWGKAEHGGALGADGRIIELKRAYIDWMPPETDLKVRMGIQGIVLPNFAGGSAVLDDDCAGITASYKFNENVGLTFVWARPYNDNYNPATNGEAFRRSSIAKTNFLDNVDVFALALPLTFDGVDVTPWVAYGIVGQNAIRYDDNYRLGYMHSNFGSDRWARQNNATDADGNPTFAMRHSSRGYANAFWAGLPVKLTLWDPLNIEFDFNYGSVESLGNGTLLKYNGTSPKSFNTRREGWLAKALVEYKMDWGTPGIFGWYASGDDGNPGNGSERMPSISPCGNFTSFLGDGNYGWAADPTGYDRNMSYAGTWGVGLQVRDMSFLEDLTHTFRVALWGGTNSPSMAKYASRSYMWESNWGASEAANESEIYMTTRDYLLEFNLVNNYKMYENFNINFELGYVVNMMDRDTWKKANTRTSYNKQDGWKAQLIFAYEF